MRTYKFRGKRLDNGEIIYGDLSVTNRPAVGNGKEWFLVDPETIAQFVGFDSDGNEIYEGDEIVQPTNTARRFTAGLPCMTIERNLYHTDFEGQVRYGLLVSADKLKAHKTNMWRGKLLYPSKEKTTVTGELEVRRNEFNPDRYDCFICDRDGVHNVDFASLERVADK